MSAVVAAVVVAVVAAVIAVAVVVARGMPATVPRGRRARVLAASIVRTTVIRRHATLPTAVYFTIITELVELGVETPSSVLVDG